MAYMAVLVYINDNDHLADICDMADRAYMAER